MIYTYSLAIPASTKPTAPVTEMQSIVSGIMRQVFIVFPDGCAGLVGTRIVARERVLWPTTPDQWFVNNNYTYVFEENLEIVGSGERIRLEAYNSDQVYQHTVYM